MSAVETNPHCAEPAETDALVYRLEQQRILADYGSHALRTRDIDAVLDRAAELAAAGMRTGLAKVLSYQPDIKMLKIVAGVGWRDGVVGVVALSADESSPAGYAFQTGESVLSNHLEHEGSFRTPELMVSHGVKRAINILIEVDGEAWGVLEVDSRDPGEFSSADFAFMRGFAHLVGVAIERHQVETSLAEAKAYQELLTREASHRVKNSLALISSLLAMQSKSQDDHVAAILNDAQSRVATIAAIHDLLWRGTDIGMVDLGEMLPALVTHLQKQAGGTEIRCEVEACTMSADMAIPLGLIANELVTNALKYAYGDGGGVVAIGGAVIEDRYELTIADSGSGFDVDALAGPDAKSLGMRMVRILTEQIGATIDYRSSAEGTSAAIILPLTT